jgi:hypothetical protein
MRLRHRLSRALALPRRHRKARTTQPDGMRVPAMNAPPEAALKAGKPLATKGLPPDVGVEIAGASILACASVPKGYPRRERGRGCLGRGTSDNTHATPGDMVLGREAQARRRPRRLRERPWPVAARRGSGAPARRRPAGHPARCPRSRREIQCPDHVQPPASPRAGRPAPTARVTRSGKFLRGASTAARRDD